VTEVKIVSPKRISEEFVPLDEGKKINIAQFNSVPNNLHYSIDVNGNMTHKEGVDFTFKKQEAEESNIPIETSKPDTEVNPFDELADDNVIVSEEFKDSEKSIDYDNQSVVSSYIGSRLNQSITKKPTSNTITGTDNSFNSYSDNKSLILDTQNLITENFLQKITSRTLMEDEYDITNENSEGFGKFIETPKAYNIHLSNNPFPRSKHSSISVSQI
jgi:hypothetical protein